MSHSPPDRPFARLTTRREKLGAGWRSHSGRGEEAVFGLASDVAANVFVVLFMAVVIGIAARPQPVEPVDYDLKGALRLTERRPNAAIDLIGALHRRQSNNGLSLDLFADRLRLSAGGNERSWRWEEIEAITAALRAIDATRPVDLFVFDSRGYSIALEGLRGRDITEVSVPAALRQCDSLSACNGRMDWSEGFRALMGQPMTDGAFRAALAELLAAKPLPVSDRVPSTMTQKESLAPTNPQSIENLKSGFLTSVWVVALIIGLVILVEGLSRRLARA